MSRKIKSRTGPSRVELATLSPLVEESRRRQITIALVDAHFDLFDADYILFLQNAAKQADILLLAIPGDQALIRYRGANGILIHEDDRAHMIEALELDSHILVYLPDQIEQIIKQVRPDRCILRKKYRWPAPWQKFFRLIAPERVILI